MKAVRVIVAIVALGAVVGVFYYFYQRKQIADMNNRAMALIDEGQFAEARSLLEQASRRAPSNYVIWKNLGYACEELSDLPKAVEAYERSLVVNPNQPEVRENVDVLKRAVEAGKQPTAQPPPQPGKGTSEAAQMAKVGLTYESMGYTTRAIEAYKRSLALDPNQPNVRQRLEALQKKAAK